MTLKLLLLALAAAPALAAQPLPALDAEKSITASGLSAGGTMAVQLHVAHSTRVKGVGAIASGPYYCAQGSLWTAYYNCMTPGTSWLLPSASTLKAQTDAFATAGKIDAASNLKSARVWLFSGTQDRTVLPQVVRGLKAFYESFQVEAVLVADKAAGHGMVTESTGNACATTAPPYINDCDYDAAGELLRHLLGSLSAPGAPGRLLEFDQQEFALKGTGLLFVPAACEQERCRVHVALHGCRQTAKEFAEGAGYNRWASGNRIVVLYPRIEPSWWPYNPRGCWDWWGYTGPLYATKEGAQIRAVMQMVERLSAPRK